jgi:molecular chaperone HtpG
MVHSVYPDHEIFVRELVSNAADACEKLRYEPIARPELTESGPFVITVALDPEQKTLTVADNGVGMTREELIAGLRGVRQPSGANKNPARQDELKLVAL